MGLIYKRLLVAGERTERECQVLFDTGASACFIRQDVAEELGRPTKALRPPTFALGDGTQITAQHTTVLQVNMDGHWIIHMFLVVPQLPVEVIIGADFLQRWKIGLDSVTEEFIIDEKALEILLV